MCLIQSQLYLIYTEAFLEEEGEGTERQRMEIIFGYNFKSKSLCLYLQAGKVPRSKNLKQIMERNQ